MKVHLVGYEAGNLGSVLRGFARVRVEATVALRPEDLADATHVLLPGVGSFASAMAVLRRDGWDVAVRRHVAAGRPLLGICLGMQLLGTSGDEGGESAGLDLIPGPTRHLGADGNILRLPHIGWNDVQADRSSPLLAGLVNGTDFYFAHSYALEPTNAAHVVGRTDYGASVAVVVESGVVYGVQFHPEKSSGPGLAILKNFADVPPC